MTLEEFMRGLDDIVKENPKIKDFIVIAANDDESNVFNKIHYSPTVANFDGHNFDTGNNKIANAVCVN